MIIQQQAEQAEQHDVILERIIDKIIGVFEKVIVAFDRLKLISEKMEEDEKEAY